MATADLSVRLPTFSAWVSSASPTSTRWPTCRCARPPSSWSTSRRPAAARPATGRTSTPSPRSARSRCAAVWCSASSPRWSTRAAAFHRRSSRSPVSRRRWCATRRRSTPCCRRFSNSPAAQCWSPTTRDSTSGFLRAAAERCEIAWPRPPVLCTVRLARRVLTRDEAPSVRLSALARLFGAGTTPTHRALDDARATVDVLHALIERVGNQGVHTYTELRAYLPDVTPEQRRKRVLAAGLPHRPGVYLFRGPANEVLYVGTAVDLRRRVNQYFNGTDPRPRIKEMATLSTAVDHVECAHDLEAGVRELRLLAAHAPPYNRRSKFPHRWWWIVLTDEAFPRFSVVRAPRGERAVGPFRSRADAVETADLLARFTGLRTCTNRIARSAQHGPACPERELSPCPAPRDIAATDYAEAPRRAQALIDGAENSALAAALSRIAELAEAQPLRDRSSAARPRRRGHRCAVARSAAACAGVGTRTGCGASRRRRRLASRGGPVRAARGGGRRAPRRSADAGGRRDQRCGTSDSARCGTTGRRARRGGRPRHALAGPTRCTDRAGRARVGVTARIGRAMGIVGRVGPVGPTGRRANPRRLRPAE